MMDVSTKLQLSRVLRQEARLVLAILSRTELAALIDQLPMDQRSAAQPPHLPYRQILDEDADRLVELGLAVRTPGGVDLTMLGRVAARVAFETRTIAPGIGVRRA